MESIGISDDTNYNADGGRDPAYSDEEKTAVEADEWFERQDHPLLNDLILNGVFKHVKPIDLISCRSVSKKWNEVTIPFTRSFFRVTIYGSLSPHPHKIENFVELFKSRKLRIPFAKFKLGSFPMTTDGVSGQQFLSLCGDTMTEVSFLDNCFNIEEVSELLKSTPKLESFTIPKCLHSKSGQVVKLFPDGSDNPKPKLNFLKKFCSSKEYPNKRIRYCPTFLEELFMAAPNISDVTIINDFGQNEWNQKCNLLEVLELIEKLGRESFIQTLIVGKPSDDHVELLEKMSDKSNGFNLNKYGKCIWGVDPIQFITLIKDGTLQKYLSFTEVCKRPGFLELSETAHLELLLNLSNSGISKEFNFIRFKKSSR